ncbi:DNRLRE domain-containing protein [Streptomyces sp. HNA39]|uniref:DNRLRE domain-containing protein n=1 Tax=Streptomyces sp. HNA39 TaxID=2850561 RepID=UPI00200C22E9|nr:DNRLRE domain-containing protein [Streptomyces sp. HNA39]UQA37191.1 DNRLRE domain-containing protein [Streptomyces sp. HNA39]
MSAPRLLSPFVRTRTRLTCTLGLLLAALTAALLPWWQPGADSPSPGGDGPAVAKPAKPVSTGLRDESAAMAEALRRGREVLVDTATSATSRTWALPDGQWRSEFHALPQRAKNAEGRWADIDTTLKRTSKADDGLDIRPANAPVPVRFSGGSGEDRDRAGRSYARLPLLTPADRAPAGDTVLAEVDIDGHTVAYTWPGVLPEPVLDGPRALYSEVLPGVDLLLVAREEGGFGQLLIVKNREAAAKATVGSLTYGLRSRTLVFRHDEVTGGVLAVDPDGGEEIASIPTPFGWDSSGRDPEASDTAPRTAVATADDVLNLSGLTGIEPGARQSPLATRLDGAGTGAARLHLDAAGSGLLTDEDVRFPVFLDPTLNSGWKAWTTAYKPYPNTSFYNGTNFSSGTSDARVGYESQTGGTGRSFWRMGYSGSLKGATVTSASFKVLNNHSWSCSKRSFQLSVTGAISSGTTWNKQPSWSTSQGTRSFAHGYGSACADEYVEYDVKNAAQQGADKGWSTLTLGMRALDEKDTYTWRKFRATSASLSVVYNRKPNQPTGGTTSPGGACVPGPGAGRTIAKANLVLSATASDPDGNLKGLRFRFWKTGGTVPAGTLVTSLSSGKGSVTIPSTSLADKTTYSWDVRSEDSAGAVSTFFPLGTEPCRITVDASAPPAPDVTSDEFLEATPDGATWATVKFGGTGSATFKASGATKFSYAFNGLNAKEVAATSGSATVTNLKPPHAGPTYLHVYAFDAVGNRSERTDHVFYVPPRDTADGPGDTGGDGRPDLLVINSAGNLRTYVGDVDGELYGSLAASYTTDGTLNPPGHWYDPATGEVALISKHSDVYPGDGVTDLFARTPDGGFWLYPGDGYGSFNVDKRLRVRLPSNAPDPATWDQIKAIGDVTGDKLPDLFIRAGASFWALTGYTGAGFQQATRMNADAWAAREIINVADIDLDGTPDLVWRNPVNGNMYVRHGKPGTVAGSVDLVSLTLAANSRDGDVPYGTSWTEANISAVVGVPDLNGDRIPDMWVRFKADGQTRVYHPSKTNTNGPAKLVISADWSAFKAFG